MSASHGRYPGSHAAGPDGRAVRRGPGSARGAARCRSWSLRGLAMGVFAGWSWCAAPARRRGRGRSPATVNPAPPRTPTSGTGRSPAAPAAPTPAPRSPAEPRRQPEAAPPRPPTAPSRSRSSPSRCAAERARLRQRHASSAGGQHRGAAGAAARPASRSWSRRTATGATQELHGHRRPDASRIALRKRATRADRAGRPARHPVSRPRARRLIGPAPASDRQLRRR